MINRIAQIVAHRTASELGLVVDRLKGTAVLTGSGTVQELANQLNATLLRTRSGSFGERDLPAPKGGKVKAYSFHWSNAQASWDVIRATGAWSADGAEFLLYVAPSAVNASLEKPWSLRDMEYVAKLLNQHPGFGYSAEMTIRGA